MNFTEILSLSGKIAGLGGLSVAVVLFILNAVVSPPALKGVSGPSRLRLLNLTIAGALVIGLAGLAAYVAALEITSPGRNSLTVGRDAKVGKDASLRGRADVGRDLTVGNDLSVGREADQPAPIQSK